MMALGHTEMQRYSAGIVGIRIQDYLDDALGTPESSDTRVTKGL